MALSRGSSGGGDSSGSQRWKLKTVVVLSSANGYTGDNGDGKEAILKIIEVCCGRRDGRRSGVVLLVVWTWC